MADLGEGPGPLFLDLTEARRAEKESFWRPGSPAYLRIWMTARSAPPAPTPLPLSQALDPALTFEQHAPIEPPRSSFSFVSVCFQGYISNTKKCTIHCCH